MIEQEEREKTVPAESATEFEMRGKMEERTGWRGQNESLIGGEEKWQVCWCYRDQQRACRMAQASVKKLEHTEPAEKERVASVPQRAIGKNARAALAKTKRNKGICPEHQMMRGERVQVGKSHTLEGERMIRVGA